MFGKDRFIEISRRFGKVCDKPECPDQWVDTFRYEGELSLEHRKPAKASKKMRKLILVLESPHTAEYCESPGPAKGATGVQIKHYLHDVVKNLRQQTDVPDGLAVVLVNAVRFPCSLLIEKDFTMTRNKVFKECWETGAAECFEQRLRELLKSGDIVINACTRGPARDTLRGRVKQRIDAVLGDGEHWRTCHPSSWWRSRNNRVPQRRYPSDEGQRTP